MLVPRIFPVLLVKDKRLINTIRFKESRYLGDPLNAVRIFNEKYVDELCIFNISSGPLDFHYFGQLAVSCRMSSTYGGGIRTVTDAVRFVSLGFEKISVSNLLFSDPSQINEIAAVIGAQSTAVTLNVSFNPLFGSYSCFSWSNPRQRFPLESVCKLLLSLCIGEVIFNCSHRDGYRTGFDIHLLEILSRLLPSSMVLSIVGGCSSSEDFINAYSDFPRFAFGATSFFVYHGNLDAVLLSYSHPFRPSDFSP